MQKFNKAAGIVLGLMVSMGISMTAYASVSSISIEVENVINEGEDLQEPKIYVESGDCEITDIQWSKDVSKWKAGNKVTATLTLETEDSFKSSYNADSCRVTGANYSSSSRIDENTMKVRLTYIPRAQLGIPEKAGWSSSRKNTAVWEKVPFAPAYQLQLLRNGDIVKTLTVTSNTADLSEFMTEEADYSYKVRAIGDFAPAYQLQLLRNGDIVKTLTVTSNTADLSEFMTEEADYSYKVRAIGETDADRYYLLSGEYAESEDITLEDLGQIGGDWYYFDSNGYKTTGWQQVGSEWYYLGQDGRMKTGWQETDGKWY